jgi:glycosyltransferase involved in cell wall biosynthesis
MNKIIIKIYYAPPPYGGVTVFNEELYNTLLKLKKDFIFFNFNKKKYNKLNILNINHRSISNIIKLFINLIKYIKINYLLQKKFNLDISIIDRIKFFNKSIAISNHLSLNNQYAALVDHLGTTQIIFKYLQLLGYNITLHTYLHGGGIIESYDKNPNLYKKLTNLSNNYIVATEFMANIYESKKDSINNINYCPPCFIKRNYYIQESIQKENIVLFIGRLNIHKNPIYLVNEWIEFKKIDNKYKLIIIGDGPLYRSIEEMLETNQDIDAIMTGEISFNKVSEYLSMSKYLILPSIREPFGKVIVEAMAKKVVPIVSDAGGMKEVFTIQAGHVFHLSPGSLTELLNKILVTDEDYHLRSKAAYFESLNYEDIKTGNQLIKILNQSL